MIYDAGHNAAGSSATCMRGLSAVNKAEVVDKQNMDDTH